METELRAISKHFLRPWRAAFPSARRRDRLVVSLTIQVMYGLRLIKFRRFYSCHSREDSTKNNTNTKKTDDIIVAIHEKILQKTLDKVVDATAVHNDDDECRSHHFSPRIGDKQGCPRAQ